jgi:hypothetical protein
MPTPRATRTSAPDLRLACAADAIPAVERPAHFALLTRLFRDHARERRPMADGADGYEFRFDADAFDDVARFVANERRCCPFLTFVVELTPNGGPLWVRLSGPEGSRVFLDAELPATTPPAASADAAQAL